MKQHPAIWKELTTVSEGDRDFRIGGICPWDQSWEDLGLQRVNLPNLAFPDELHERHVYRINAGTQQLVFCAFEVSANVWRFWVPKSPAAV